MKYVLYSVLALIIAGGIGYLLMRLLTGKRNVSKGRKTLLAVLMSLLVILAGSLTYLIPYSRADESCFEELVSDSELTFIRNEDGMTHWYGFVGENNDTVLIFYPGAKVDSAAYVRLMKETARKGIDVYVVEFPFHMAFFNMNAAGKILKDKNYENIYIGGHSLGGVAACSYAQKSADKVDGIILLASYPTDKIDDKLRLLSIYGDKDGCLEMNAYNDAKLNWPINHFEEIITGGNHAQFAQYGKQRGDNEASITTERQIEITADVICRFMGVGNE